MRIAGKSSNIPLKRLGLPCLHSPRLKPWARWSIFRGFSLRPYIPAGRLHPPPNPCNLRQSPLARACSSCHKCKQSHLIPNPPNSENSASKTQTACFRPFRADSFCILNQGLYPWLLIAPLQGCFPLSLVFSLWSPV